MALTWSLHNTRGILWDAATSRWRGGHVNDVLEVASNFVLAASETGGVWLLSSGFGLSLSMDWDAPDMNALARGPRGPSHFLAGGGNATGSAGALYETDTSAAFPLLSPWRPIALPPGVGVINRMVLDGSRIVLATTSGLWYATIPPNPTGAAAFALASGVAGDVNFMDVVVAAGHSIVAATAGADDGTGRLGYFVGAWNASGALVMRHVPISLSISDFQYPSLAVAPSDPRTLYAACCDNDDVPAASGTFRGLMRSTDGGMTWELRTAYLAGTTTIITEHDQLGYTGAIAVSPTDANTLVLGYTAGPYVSRDGGATFAPTDRNLTHDDKHSYRFTAAGRLYEASDGGVSYTDDLGATFQSGLNEHIANLQFLGPDARDWWGRTSASAQIKGLVGGGLQDNDDVYSLRAPNGSTTPWQVVSAGGDYDGQAVFFPRIGDAIFTYGDVRAAQWEPPLLVPDASPIIPVRAGKPGVTYSNNAVGGVMALVVVPEWRNADGLLMWGVLASGSDIYGLFANEDGSDKHFDYLGTLPLPSSDVVSALASLSGRTIFAGVRGHGQIWKIDQGNLGTFGAAIASTGLPPDAGWAVFVVDIVVVNDSLAFAAYNNGNSGAGQIYASSDGVAWSPVPWSPGSQLCCLAIDRVGLMLYTATDDQVYASDYTGTTWSSQSAGLPRRPHCSDISCVYHADGTGYLYLSTFGWSTWVTPLPPPLRVQRPVWVLPRVVLGPTDAGIVPIHSPDPGPGPEIGLAIYRLAASLRDASARATIQTEALKSMQAEMGKLVTPSGFNRG